MARAPRNQSPTRAPGARVVLRAGREKPLINRHPWIFSGAIESLGDQIRNGDVADVVAQNGDFLARGHVNRQSQIVVRVLTFDRAESIDRDFFSSRLRRAVQARPGNPAERWVNAESDGLPGLIVDRYGDHAVLQASTLGMNLAKAELAALLRETSGVRGVYDRSDGDGRDKEGLGPETGLLLGEEPADLVRVEERTAADRSVVLLVDVRGGHKTGAYLDQRENRRIVGEHSNGASVLNLFSYTGGFSLHALAGGAKSAVNVDSSAPALALSDTIARENGFLDRVEHVKDDVFSCIRRFASERKSFDVVVCDPPKFAHGAAQVDRAARAYKDLNRIALGLVRPGGFFATFSCSGAISPDLFQKIVFSASVEAKRDAQILARLSQAPDHPVLLSFPEGEYLKGLFCRVF